MRTNAGPHSRYLCRRPYGPDRRAAISGKSDISGTSKARDAVEQTVVAFWRRIRKLILWIGLD